MTQIRTTSARATHEAGAAYAAHLRPGDVVALYGTLGSGKTQFVTGACSALGVTVRVTSPTFVLINEYPAPFGCVAHVDLYRIRSRAELVELGIEEYFRPSCICFVEWPEVAASLLPPSSRRVEFRHGDGESDREILIADRGDKNE